MSKIEQSKIMATLPTLENKGVQELTVQQFGHVWNMGFYARFQYSGNYLVVIECQGVNFEKELSIGTKSCVASPFLVTTFA
jgi:hypothetical protein